MAAIMSRGFQGKCRWDRQDPQLTKRNPKRAVNRYAMQAALGMMRKVHKASRIASYMGSMATVTQGAVTMVAIATTMLPGAETFGCPQTMAYQESINVSNSFIEGRSVPEPRTVSDDRWQRLLLVTLDAHDLTSYQGKRDSYAQATAYVLICAHVVMEAM